MVEELYIIHNGERLKLDLAVPSGITLNFKSNLFGDLSKITASYSYTFKLPMTANNRRVFDMADDIRHNSCMIRKRLKCEFIQNGIPLLSNANLYVDTVDSNFQAVMTWGVIRGFDAIKSNDLSLRNIDFSNLQERVARYLGVTSVPRPSDWSGTLDYFIPFRKSERSYLYNNQNYVYSVGERGSAMLPVVPVYRIINAINDYYGTTFYFGEPCDGSENWDVATQSFKDIASPDIISFGAVPLVNRELTREQYNSRTGLLTNLFHVNLYSILGYYYHNLWNELSVYNVISFDFRAVDKDGYFEVGNDGVSTTRNFTFYRARMAQIEKVELDGNIIAVFSTIGNQWENGNLVYTNTDIPKMILYKRNKDTSKDEVVYDEVSTIDGELVGHERSIDGNTVVEFAIFSFDFRDSEGKDRIELENFNDSSEDFPYFFSIDHRVRELKSTSDIKIVPSGCISDNMIDGYEVDIVSNLPDVSCMTFLKSLYFMIGAFPDVDKNGRIVPLYYSDLYSRIESHDVLDWSKKVVSSDSELPNKITYKISGFAQENYYLMGNDKTDNDYKDKDKREDIYDSGMGCIVCDNETLDKSKTIIQVPWYGEFLQDSSHPSYETGRDMKYYKFNADNTKEFVEAKPAIGIVRPVEECLYQSPLTEPPTPLPQGTYVMMFHVWNGFKHILSDPSYSTLQRIANNPIIVTEYLNLNEFDLKNLDYAKPVFIEKYNSYFAIVSISRDNKGKCKCELLKLPQ